MKLRPGASTKSLPFNSRYLLRRTGSRSDKSSKFLLKVRVRNRPMNGKAVQMVIERSYFQRGIIELATTSKLESIAVIRQHCLAQLKATFHSRMLIYL